MFEYAIIFGMGGILISLSLGIGYICGCRHVNRLAAKRIQQINSKMAAHLEKCSKADSTASTGASKLHLRQK